MPVPRKGHANRLPQISVFWTHRSASTLRSFVVTSRWSGSKGLMESLESLSGCLSRKQSNRGRRFARGLSFSLLD